MELTARTALRRMGNSTGMVARIEARLDEAVAALRDANDPARDETIRQRVLEELKAHPFELDFAPFLKA